MKSYKRAIKLKLYITKSKQRKIKALVEAYRKAVNFYLKLNDPKLNKETLATLQNSKLSERYKSNALKQAIGVYKSCLKTKKKTPKFNGFPILDTKFIDIQNGNNSFDLWIKLSTLARGKRIYMPTKKHKQLNYWLSKGTLIQGCELHEDKIIVWIDVEQQENINTKQIGIDIGMNKLITTSDGEFFGKDIKCYLNNILSKKKNSQAYKRSIKQMDNYVNQEVNKLDWNNLSLICHENLKFMKKGKLKLRSNKNFRIKQQHWSYRKVISRIKEKAQENRVRLVYVNPKNTSRMCPSCKNVDEFNRNNEDFSCLTCGYKQDADIVGAINIFNKGCDWIRSLESLNKKTTCTI